MRNGASVTYDMQLSILNENRQLVLRRGFERFVVSYDLWEEKFSATRMRTARTSASHLTRGSGRELVSRPFERSCRGARRPISPSIVRLDIRAQEPKDRRASDDDDRYQSGPTDRNIQQSREPVLRNPMASRGGPDFLAVDPATEQQAVNRLRNRLLLVFLAATLAPLAATLWITTTLLDRSLSMATTNEVDELSRSLQATGRALFTATQDALKLDAAHTTPRVYQPPSNRWPEDVRQFFDTEEPERFQLAGESQDRIDYLVRRGPDVHVYSRPIAGPGMKKLAQEYATARDLVDKARARDLRRGFFWTLVLAAAAIWAVCLFALTLVTSRITRPMEQLTAGLAELASGNLNARLTPRGHDEIGEAMCGF